MDQVSHFGTLADGREVQQVILACGAFSARFLTLGAILQDLRFDPHPFSLVVGLPTLEDYLADPFYFGATVGRCANRIAKGHFRIDGQEFEVERNSGGRHSLHGGSDGLGARLWSIKDCSPSQLTLADVLPDGHMGFPGQLRVEAQFTLTNAGLDICYRANCDAPTLCNLAHHSYWILDDSGSILNHLLKIPAEHVCAVDNDLIPTGDLAPVAGSRLDFRAPARIGKVTKGGAIDHNFCMGKDRGPLGPVATLASTETHLTLDVLTTEPGLQVFDAGPIEYRGLDLDGRRVGPHCGLALEAQMWPDAINHPEFVSPVLTPGDRYEQQTQFRIKKG